MKTSRLFATVLMVAMCAMVATSCSDDDGDKKNKDKELMSLIIGKWEFRNDYDYVWEFKSNGTWLDNYADYQDGGKFWIESEVLYMESKNEDETWHYPIKSLDSSKLTLYDDGDYIDIYLYKVH